MMGWVVIALIVGFICCVIVLAGQASELHAQAGIITVLQSQQSRDQALIGSLKIETEELQKRLQGEEDRRRDLERFKQRFKQRVENAGQPRWED